MVLDYYNELAEQVWTFSGINQFLVPVLLNPHVVKVHEL